jgi:hypothetical protein
MKVELWRGQGCVHVGLRGSGAVFSADVERLYCKRPIQCLPSSKILTPQPLTARRVCPPPPAFGAGGGHMYKASPI